MPILLHYFWLCLNHVCNVNAHAKNIPTLLMTVLCPILCKLLTQQPTAKFLLHPQLGGTSGVWYICVHLYCTYSDCDHTFVSCQPWHLPVCTDSTEVARTTARDRRLSQSDCQKNLHTNGRKSRKVTYRARLPSLKIVSNTKVEIDQLEKDFW